MEINLQIQKAGIHLCILERKGTLVGKGLQIQKAGIHSFMPFSKIDP